MSESLRNDGRIWVPKKLEDVKAIRSGVHEDVGDHGFGGSRMIHGSLG